ncbi:unnamed protein product [Caenorhabditis bovis]|uniref:Uncharacterized protein n=1 Tax=Caenorhabditis bovis TaxID=2654633 RepID=A0A8S1F3C0_9PELO|nr:unnamed protein product [Caenorhabditis bovis]
MLIYITFPSRRPSDHSAVHDSDEARPKISDRTLVVIFNWYNGKVVEAIDKDNVLSPYWDNTLFITCRDDILLKSLFFYDNLAFPKMQDYETGTTFLPTDYYSRYSKRFLFTMSLDAPKHVKTLFYHPVDPLIIVSKDKKLFAIHPKKSIDANNCFA